MNEMMDQPDNMYLVRPSMPPGLKNSGRRSKLTTAAPPRPMLCTRPYLPRLSAVSKSPGACIEPAPVHAIRAGDADEHILISTYNHEVALFVMTWLGHPISR